MIFRYTNSSFTHKYIFLWIWITHSRNANGKYPISTFITSPRMVVVRVYTRGNIRQVQIKFPRDSVAIFHVILRITRIPHDTRPHVHAEPRILRTFCSDSGSIRLGPVSEPNPHAIHFRWSMTKLDFQVKYNFISFTLKMCDQSSLSLRYYFFS
jgi:hypothetical protein